MVVTQSLRAWLPDQCSRQSLRACRPDQCCRQSLVSLQEHSASCSQWGWLVAKPACPYLVNPLPRSALKCCIVHSLPCTVRECCIYPGGMHAAAPEVDVHLARSRSEAEAAATTAAAASRRGGSKQELGVVVEVLGSGSKGGRQKQEQGTAASAALGVGDEPSHRLGGATQMAVFTLKDQTPSEGKTLGTCLHPCLLPSSCPQSCISLVLEISTRWKFLSPLDSKPFEAVCA